MQLWKQYNNWYSVSNDGQVRLDHDLMRSRAGKILPAHTASNGYKQVQLSIDSNGHRSFQYVHRLVAITWLAQEPGKPHVNHKDGNKANNHCSNLEWCTPKENKQHAIKNGLTNTGTTKVTRRNRRGAPNKYDKQFISKLLCAFNNSGSYASAGRTMGISRQYASQLIKTII